MERMPSSRIRRRPGGRARAVALTVAVLYVTSVWGDSQTLPGRLLAREFDDGGEGVAYHDEIGALRGDELEWERAGVDVNVYQGAVSYVHSSEWLRFSADAIGGTYDVFYHISSAEATPQPLDVYMVVGPDACNDLMAKREAIFASPEFSTPSRSQLSTLEASSITIPDGPVELKVCFAAAEQLDFRDVVIIPPRALQGLTCEEDETLCFTEGKLCVTDRRIWNESRFDVAYEVVTHMCLDNPLRQGPCTVGTQEGAYNNCGFGHCSEQGVDLVCDCLPGWALTSNTFVQAGCFTPAPCFPDPCGVGGFCDVDMWGEPLCKCHAGYYGESCEILGVQNPDQRCSTNSVFTAAGPAQTTGDAGIVCVAMQDSEGGEVRLIAKYAANDCQCFNGGTCDSESMSCVCPREYIGEHCEFENKCVTTTGDCDGCYSGEYLCGPNAKCIPYVTADRSQSLVSDFECECSPGYALSTDGQYPMCQVVFQSCEETPGVCRNGATCVNVMVDQAPLDFACECAPGWFGDTCEWKDLCSIADQRKVDLCVGDLTCTAFVSCSSGGCESSYACQDIATSSELPCDSADLAPDCQNGSTCVNEFKGYWTATCECPPGYSGDFCEEQACGQALCNNGGTCSEGLATGEASVCTCSAEFADWGYDCGQSPCGLADCGTHGSCVASGKEAWQCVCDEGWDLAPSVTPSSKGICSVSLCPAGACSHGTCEKQKDGSYACVCERDWEGETCNALKACSPNPCGNGAACVPLMVGPSQYGHECKCGLEWGGSDCTIERSSGEACAEDCFGQCLAVTPKGFSCVCYAEAGKMPLHTGPQCLDPLGCDSQPCENGGKCLPGGACACAMGYAGINCQIRVGELCDSGMCEHGATCDGGLCNCAAGWGGRYCWTPVAN
jgi:hypothetical protein